jgi:uncharacterized protein (DUF2336 family)
MTEAFSIEGLMEAARDSSPEGRSRLFSLLGQLFLARGSGLSEGERHGFSELLQILRPVANPEARLEIAFATAEAGDAPAELARLMAEDEIEIAALVLFRAEALEAGDLMRLIEDPARAGIIAGRRGLPMAVVDTLMRRGEPELARALLKNDGIKLSIPALAEAIEMARSDPDLQRRIAARPELMEEMALEMAEWADPEVRTALNERFELNPTSSLIDRLKALTSLGLESGPPREPDFAAPDELASEAVPSAAASPLPDDSEMPPPDPRFRLSPRLIIETLRRGDRIHAETMFGAMAGLPMHAVRRFAKEPKGEGIALAARAIGMAREEFATIYLLWRKALSSDGLVAAGQLGAALDLFDTIPQDRVEVERARWRRDQMESA